ncbi:4'-phosphopantetheinyl transferase superfamily protein [Cellulomonas sp. DKR-3]|uniref:4'-phosphopantetheinyl transferase superfamily protein n=1 Tax=Cellulomonas fulva TaxID=2835530 RepID=A0ABS5U357_9CELL|nr:4'-phosphopantetheinyl transferase superfamily protein [Cellulomonas fulva]MBT0995771.1 4'-phosphopantetheinyl transferase superfamily protein [Cellulomonas fulva]
MSRLSRPARLTERGGGGAALGAAGAADADGLRVAVRHEPVTGPSSPEREGLLAAPERERRDRLLRPADRAAYTAAHALVRECAAELLGVPAAALDLKQTCSACGGAGHGRPALVGHPEVGVSLSHTDGHVAAIAAVQVATVPDATVPDALVPLAAPGRSAAPPSAPAVGIDVERVREVPDAVLTARERAWVAAAPDPHAAATSLWVRKEALVKAGALELTQLGGCDVLDTDALGDDGPASAALGHALRGWSGDGVVGAWSVPEVGPRRPGAGQSKSKIEFRS